MLPRYWRTRARSNAIIPTVVAFGALSVLLALLAGYWLYYAWNAVRSEKIDALRNLVQVSASSGNQFFQHYESSLPMLAQDVMEQWRGANQDALSERLRRFRRSDGNVSAVYTEVPRRLVVTWRV